ncbi:glycosyl transferase family 90-domain-containing protein [Mycena floridula]|nr:glycosyl transferase family 90-domain-containing protein [Mycena floridula]
MSRISSFLQLNPQHSGEYTLLRPEMTPDFERLAETGLKSSRRTISRRMQTRLLYGALCLIVLLIFLFASGIMIQPRQSMVWDEHPIPPPNPGSLDPLDPQTHARLHLEALRARQSTTLAQASARYTLKTNRQPPPNYDRWFDFARQKQCLIDDYDQIHRDFEPFYQIAAKDPKFFGMMVERAIAQLKPDGIGMKTAKFQGGIFEHTDGHGTAYDGDWNVTFERFSNAIPDMRVVLNGRDEPRVLFNPREPGALQRALTENTDENSFHHRPAPSSLWFKDRKKCIIENNPNGFTEHANDVSGFLIDASSSDFTTALYPLLSITKVSPCFADILMPAEYYYSHSGWGPRYGRPNDIQWNDKKPVLYWRGATSGGKLHSPAFRGAPRFRVIDIARNHSDILDVKLTSFQGNHCGPDCDGEAIKKEYNIDDKSKDPREDVYKYKYVLDIDGNTFSGRYFGLLRSGTLVFKSTIFLEFFGDWLKPFEHYIPVLPDLSDLVEKVKWARANEAEARRIQETGRLFAEKVLNDAQNDCYFFMVMLEWARLWDISEKAKMR